MDDGGERLQVVASQGVFGAESEEGAGEIGVVADSEKDVGDLERSQALRAVIEDGCPAGFGAVVGEDGGDGGDDVVWVRIGGSCGGEREGSAGSGFHAHRAIEEWGSHWRQI